VVLLALHAHRPAHAALVTIEFFVNDWWDIRHRGLSCLTLAVIPGEFARGIGRMGAGAPAAALGGNSLTRRNGVVGHRPTLLPLLCRLVA